MKVTNINKCLNAKTISAIEKITNGINIFKQPKLIQFLPLNAQVYQKDKNWYLDQSRVHLQDPSLYRNSWFLRQYLYATTETTIMQFDNVRKRNPINFDQYIDWNIECLEQIYRRINIQKLQTTGIEEGKNKEIFLIGNKNTTAKQILSSKFLSTLYTTKYICIQNIEQLEIQDETIFFNFLRENDVKLITFENLNSLSVIDYVKTKRKYNKIFLEDDVLLSEYLDQEIGIDKKPDLLIIGYLVQEKHELDNQQPLGKKFPNFNELLRTDYGVDSAKQGLIETFLTLEKQKEDKEYENDFDQIKKDSFYQHEIQQEAKIKAHKAKVDYQKQRRQKYKQQNNL